MNICLVGGIFDRAEHLRAKHVFTPETVLRDGLHEAGIPVHSVGHARFEPAEEYDIVHVHHFGRAALKMATARTRARFVFTGHIGLIVTGYERAFLRRYAFEYVIGKADAVVALSRAENEYFQNTRAAGRVYTIPNGIPADVFQAAREAPGREESGQRRYHLLYVGQLIEWKGVKYLLEAVRQLRQQFNLRLRLVYHNACLEETYRRMAADLGIAKEVEFVGILGPAALAKEYQQADLLVLPSFADCLPSVVTEALLCGTPVVAGAVCGVPDQVGKYGRVVPPGDVPALVAAIESVLNALRCFQAMAQEMRTYAQEKFCPRSMVAAHLALYESLKAGVPALPMKASWMDGLARLAVRAYWRNASVCGK